MLYAQVYLCIAGIQKKERGISPSILYFASTMNHSPVVTCEPDFVSKSD